jgi:hypothetical protein
MSLLSVFHTKSHTAPLENETAHRTPVLRTPRDYRDYFANHPIEAYNKFCRSGIEHKVTERLNQLQERHLNNWLEDFLANWSN